MTFRLKKLSSQETDSTIHQNNLLHQQVQNNWFRKKDFEKINDSQEFQNSLIKASETAKIQKIIQKTHSCQHLKSKQVHDKIHIHSANKIQNHSSEFRGQICKEERLLQTREKSLFDNENSWIKAKIQKRQKQKSRYINQNIYKLKTIAEKLNSLKDNIQDELEQKNKVQFRPVKQNYYIDNLLTSLTQNELNSTTFQHFAHFSKNYKTLKHLMGQNQVQIIIENQNRQYERKRSNPSTKPILVMDLDQTLVWAQRVSQKNAMNPVYLHRKDQTFCFSLSIRPFADKFIAEASKHFRIFIFSSASQNYVQQVTYYLDPQRKFIEKIFYKEHTLQVEVGKYKFHIKDLRMLEEDLSRVVFVDNSIYSYVLQLQNGIPITPFRGNHLDCELEKLLTYLKELSEYHNLAKKNNEYFKQAQYNNFFDRDLSVKDIIKKLYLK